MIEEIIRVFEKFRMAPSKIDGYDIGGREVLAQKLAPFVNNRQRIQFVMLGYPFKSTNHVHKTIGIEPDMAEAVSIENFKKFGDEMIAVHPAGINVVVASDGYVFNDLLEERDCVVRNYGEIVEDMMRGSPVELMELMDFYNCSSLPCARDKVMEQFGITDAELEQRVLFDPNINALYRGMIRFMEEELAYKSFPSRNQLHKAAKKLARDMMFRNEAYSHLISSQFPDSIRLSMHPSTNNGKYSFQLIPSPKAHHSPWHCALLINKDGSIETVHKQDAEAAGHELVLKGDQPWHYQEK